MHMVLTPSTPGRFSFTADAAKAAYEAKFARDPATYAWLAENSIDHYEKLIKMAVQACTMSRVTLLLCTTK